jgi:hypothetical protein
MLLTALVIALALGPVDVWAMQTRVTTDEEITAFKEMAAAIPLGSRVKAQTTAGRRLSGTLMRVTDDSLIIKKGTRVPEPAVTVPFADLAQLELQMSEGMGPAKVIGIGLAAGAGAILTLFGFLAALDD